jgi:2-haloacid dehalogenase
MLQPQAVIFDIGNVLLEWQPERFYDRVIGPARRRALFDEVDILDMNLEVDAGAPFKATIYERAERYPEWGPEIRLWHDRWIEIAHPVIDRSVRILRALRSRGVPVFALTNFGDESYAYAQTQFDFLNEFDREYVSGRLKCLKPTPQIYQVVERDCGIAPEVLLFTDDKPENVAGAAARGWQTHLFTNSAGLAAVLVAAGLLTESEAA